MTSQNRSRQNQETFQCFCCLLCCRINQWQKLMKEKWIWLDGNIMIGRIGLTHRSSFCHRNTSEKEKNIFPFSPKYLAKQGINPENQILLRKCEIHFHPFSSILIYYHLLPPIVVHFHPLPSIWSWLYLFGLTNSMALQFNRPALLQVGCT